MARRESCGERLKSAKGDFKYFTYGALFILRTERKVRDLYFYTFTVN